jgi:hypothetical protein
MSSPTYLNISDWDMKWRFQKVPIGSLQGKVLSSGGFLGFAFHITLNKRRKRHGKILIVMGS